MKRDSFSYEVNSEVFFTPEEIKNLMHCSVTHYDYKCKAAGQHGGFLYGLNNRFVLWPAEEADDPDRLPSAPAKLSWREVDTLCKILESPSADPGLAWAMRELIVDMRIELERLYGEEESNVG
jgi:hypothetical protein